MTATTGGQWNLSGVLYQLLVTLNASLGAKVEEVVLGKETAAVRVVVEPDLGGDSQTHQPNLRTVDQIKIRRGASPWTTRKIIEEVLPDLYKAASADSSPTRFRFVTDRLDGTSAFSAFLASVGELALEGKGPGDLDTANREFRWGNARIAAAGLFANAVKSLSLTDADLWRLLVATEVTSWPQSGVIAEIDAILGELVDEREDIVTKRKALLADLLGLGSAGASLSVDSLLRAADLDPARLTVVQRLPGILAAHLRDASRRLQYDPGMDVRAEPVLPEAALSVLSGPSGQGKTWRLVRLGHSLVEQGRCVVLLPAVGTLTQLEAQLVELTWLHSFDRHLPLAKVAGRLRPKLAGEDSVWLTVLLDDLADPGLADELVAGRWQRLGIRIVLTAQSRIARKLSKDFEGLSEAPVPDFTLAQVQDYLRRAGRDPTLVPDDVLSSLTRPVLAGIYARIPGSEQWQSVSEYELMDRYWTWATTETRTQSLHISDGDAVLQLAGSLLEERPVYPWTPRVFRKMGLTETARDRLITVGLLREDDAGGLEASHDRILNWAVAGEIARQFVERDQSPDDIAAMLHGLDEIKTSTGGRIGLRLGYVLSDVFWMLARRAKPEEVGGLALMWVRSGTPRLEEKRFFEAGLGTLGAAILPTLEWLARQRFTREEPFFHRHVASALVAVSTVAASDVSAIALRLVQDDVEESRSVGLITLASVPGSGGLDRLWSINRDRQIALAAARASDEGAIDRIRAQEESFAALLSASRVAPGWLRAKALSVVDGHDADQLIWLLIRLEVRIAKPIWLEAKGNLLSRLTPMSRSIPRAVRHFQDRAELDRRHAAIGTAELAPALWFDALVAIAPEDALAYLDSIGTSDLWGTSHWWLYGLVRRLGAEANRRLAERVVAEVNDPQLAHRDLATLYLGELDCLDVASFEGLLDAFEACLEREAAGEPEQPGVRRHLRTLIASADTPILLERLAARRGSRLESLIAQRARRPGRQSMYVDRTGEEYHQILAAIGGEGFDQAVLAELDRESRFGRTDGVAAAVWTANADVKARLEALATEADDDTFGRVKLMHALAAHRSDTGLRAMVLRGAPVFLDAVSIRDGGPPVAAENLAEVGRLLTSADATERLHGINLCGFLGRDVAGTLLAPFLEAEDQDAEESNLARGVLMHLGYYRPSFLSGLRRRLTRGEGGEAIARYLAGSGDEEARTSVVAWLEGHPLKSLNVSVLSIAFRLLEFEDSAEGGRLFLKRVRQAGLGWGYEGQILSALADAGDNEAAVSLEAVAHQAPGRGTDSVIAAIRTLARSSHPEAMVAAERFYRKARQAEAAKLMMRLDPEAGGKILLDDYISAPVPVRHQIGRLMRRHAPRAAYLDRLQEMSLDAADERREEAAELAGWLPAGEAVDYLDRLVDDEAEAVGKAALAAIRRRQTDAECGQLLAMIADQPRPRQWAWLRAMMARGEPAHFVDPADPLSILPLIDRLGEEFRLEANKCLTDRSKALEKEAEKLEADRP
jgi:hypothetical protein